MKVNLDPFDSLRGIASVIVVLGHLLTYWTPNTDNAAFPQFAIEYLSPVTLFFIISGFTLVTVYDKDGAPHNPVPPEIEEQLRQYRAQGVDAHALPLTQLPPNAVPAPTTAQVNQIAIAAPTVAVTTPTDSPATFPAPASSYGPVYLYYYPLPAPEPLSTRQERLTFFRRRVARLAPVYYCALILGIAPLIVYNFDSIAWEVPLAVLWLQSFTCLVGNAWVGPLWTASAFAFLYLLFPSLLRCCRRSTTSKLWQHFANLSGTSIGIMLTWIFRGGLPYAFFLHAFVGFRILHFALGIVAGLLVKRYPTFRATLIAEACTFLLLANFITCAVLCTGDIGFYVVYMYFSEFIIGPVQALWLMALSHPSCAGPTKRVLMLTPLRKLGDISYSLYCTHWPVLCWCAWAVANKGVTYDAVPNYGGAGWFFFPPWAIPILLVVCIAVATLVHWLLERPARKAIAKTQRVPA
jgi:peptidoglycan/LPS O-acetylase OafA/YrhL